MAWLRCANSSLAFGVRHAIQDAGDSIVDEWVAGGHVVDDVRVFVQGSGGYHLVGCCGTVVIGRHQSLD